MWPRTSFPRESFPVRTWFIFGISVPESAIYNYLAYSVLEAGNEVFTVSTMDEAVFYFGENVQAVFAVMANIAPDAFTTIERTIS